MKTTIGKGKDSLGQVGAILTVLAVEGIGIHQLLQSAEWRRQFRQDWAGSKKSKANRKSSIEQVHQSKS